MSELTAARQATVFEPDYRHMVAAARNRTPERYPLYEHGISFHVMEAVLGCEFAGLWESRDPADLREFFRHHNEFYRRLGYDTVTWESGVGGMMPGSGALGGHQPGVIKDRGDFERYPWDEVEGRFFAFWGPYLDALAETLPPGMRAIGGCGNGVFECVQDVVGYEALCLVRVDDPELYAALFARVGTMLADIWRRFLARYGEAFAVCRFGDDLGFKSAPLIAPHDIRTHVIPCYRRIIAQVHAADKPFLLHSCGCIFDVMDDLIEVAAIDAKHSNEDVIAPFTTWVERYGDRIGNFGGIDMDVLCQSDAAGVRAYTLDVLNAVRGRGGLAFGSGNSIPDYVPVEGYLAMVNTVRQWRGTTG